MAHWRSKQTQVPSGGMLLSHPVGGGAEAAATQRFGRHGSSHAQSLSFAHGATPDAPSLDAADGVALGSVGGLAPGECPMEPRPARCDRTCVQSGLVSPTSQMP